MRLAFPEHNQLTALSIELGLTQSQAELIVYVMILAAVSSDVNLATHTIQETFTTLAIPASRAPHIVSAVYAFLLTLASEDD